MQRCARGVMHGQIGPCRPSQSSPFCYQSPMPSLQHPPCMKGCVRKPKDGDAGL